MKLEKYQKKMHCCGIYHSLVYVVLIRWRGGDINTRNEYVRRLLTPNKEIIFKRTVAVISADEMGASRYKFPGPGGAAACTGPDYLAR